MRVGEHYYIALDIHLRRQPTTTAAGTYVYVETIAAIVRHHGERQSFRDTGIHGIDKRPVRSRSHITHSPVSVIHYIRSVYRHHPLRRNCRHGDERQKQKTNLPYHDQPFIIFPHYKRTEPATATSIHLRGAHHPCDINAVVNVVTTQPAYD